MDCDLGKIEGVCLDTDGGSTRYTVPRWRLVTTILYLGANLRRTRTEPSCHNQVYPCASLLAGGSVDEEGGAHLLDGFASPLPLVRGRIHLQHMQRPLADGAREQHDLRGEAHRRHRVVALERRQREVEGVVPASEISVCVCVNASACPRGCVRLDERAYTTPSRFSTAAATMSARLSSGLSPRTLTTFKFSGLPASVMLLSDDGVEVIASDDATLPVTGSAQTPSAACTHGLGTCTDAWPCFTARLVATSSYPLASMSFPSSSKTGTDCPRASFTAPPPERMALSSWYKSFPRSAYAGNDGTATSAAPPSRAERRETPRCAACGTRAAELS